MAARIRIFPPILLKMRKILAVSLFCAVARAQQDAAPFGFTGDFTSENADRLPSGKFATLRVNVGVQTGGGTCSLAGTLSDAAGKDVDFRNAGSRLSSGKGVIPIDFQGAKIAARGIDGPLFVSGLMLTCYEGITEVSRKARSVGRFATAPVHASDFDDRKPDFEFVANRSAPIAAGDPAFNLISIRTIGAFDSFLKLVADAQPPLAAHLSNMWGCPVGTRCWAEPRTTGLVVTTPADVTPGEYTVRLTGTSGVLEHAIEVKVVVNAGLTEFKR